MENSLKSKLYNSTLFSLFFTATAFTPFPISSNSQSYLNNTEPYEYVMSINSFDNNLNMTTKYYNKDFLLNEKLKELKSCINCDSTNFGEDDISYQYFMLVRQDEFYEDIFTTIKNDSYIYRLALLNILSQIDFSNIFSMEKEFVISSMYDENLTIQEYALNAISQWNDNTVIKYISHIKIKNTFLQNRLNKIIERIN